MKKIFLATIFALSAMLLFTPIVFAQTTTPPEPSTIDMANLFTWATSSPPNWVQGVLYGVLGLAGALITIYFVMGGTIPTSAGVKLEVEFKMLEQKEKELAELRKKALDDPNSVNADLIREFSMDADRLRDDLERKSQSMFVGWAALYVFLGIFFAMMLAQDLLQAIILGAGWTSVLGAFGLYRESKEAKNDAAQQADVVEKSIRELEKKLIQMKEMSDAGKLEWNGNLDFEQNVENVENAVRKTKLRAKAF
jgi:hypothetical protein